jgi:hypothetical protein
MSRRTLSKILVYFVAGTFLFSSSVYSKKFELVNFKQNTHAQKKITTFRETFVKTFFDSVDEQKEKENITQLTQEEYKEDYKYIKDEEELKDDREKIIKDSLKDALYEATAITPFGKKAEIIGERVNRYVSYSLLVNFSKKEDDIERKIKKEEESEDENRKKERNLELELSSSFKITKPKNSKLEIGLNLYGTHIDSYYKPLKDKFALDLSSHYLNNIFGTKINFTLELEKDESKFGTTFEYKF